MKLLIVSATRNEIKPLEDYLLQRDEESAYRTHSIEMLVTGPGSTFTAFHLGKMLPLDNWDLAINLGICGSFNREIPIGASVYVFSDRFADLGAEDDHSFLDIFDLGLADKNKFPFDGGWLNSTILPGIESIKNIPKVKGITVNTVSGNEATIEKLRSRFHADIESMEGAAFMFCCMKESIPFLQLRTVSNYIEKREKSKWDLALAVKNLNETAIKIITELLGNQNDRVSETAPT